jgi:hypothetical protein
VPDVGLTQIFNPQDACELSSTENLDLYIVNMGTDTLSTMDTVVVIYQVDDGTIVNDTLFPHRKVIPGDSIFFSARQKVDLSATGIHEFDISLDYSSDLIASNDQLIRNIEVFGNPTVSLGEDQEVNLKTYELDAGSGFVSYWWQDGSGNQTYTVEYEDQEPDQTYTVFVTDANGCQGTDEVVITFELTDIGIETVLNPVSGCDLTSQEQVIVRIRNYGTTSIFNQRIDLTAIVNGRAPVNGRKTVSTLFNPGDSLVFAFGSNFDLSADGDHTVHVDISLGIDPFTSNDTVDLVISNIENPVIDLGGFNDTLGRNLPHTFDAGADYEFYLWNGVEGDRTFEANAYGWYKLVVTDANGCTGIDSVYLDVYTRLPDIIKFDDLKIYPNPSDDILFIEFENSGYLDIYLEIFDGTGRKILVREFNQADRIHEPVDVSGIPEGVYYLKIRSGNHQSVSKIVIQ